MCNFVSSTEQSKIVDIVSKLTKPITKTVDIYGVGVLCYWCIELESIVGTKKSTDTNVASN